MWRLCFTLSLQTNKTGYLGICAQVHPVAAKVLEGQEMTNDGIECVNLLGHMGWESAGRAESGF